MEYTSGKLLGRVYCNHKFIGGSNEEVTEVVEANFDWSGLLAIINAVRCRVLVQQVHFEKIHCILVPICCHYSSITALSSVSTVVLLNTSYQ